MRDKIYNILNKTYGVILAISFFAGLIPVLPFIVAIIIGGPTAELICTFIYKEYYPWIIAMAAISVVVGWVASYIKKPESSAKKEDKE